MTKTVIGLLEKSQDAQAVLDELAQTCGTQRTEVDISGRPKVSVRKEHEGFFERMMNSVRELIGAGVPEDEAHAYAEGVRRGGTLITVRAATDEAASCAVRVLEGQGAIDIHQSAAQWREQGWNGRIAESGKQVLEVGEEELTVGKREVARGGVRVYTQVREVPVEEKVSLREEHAKVERTPVDRPAQAGEELFQEKSLEVSETGEEPVVGKRARVTEEVRIGKEASQREETVHDTVRKTDVRVEPYRGPERRKSKSATFAGTERRAIYR